MLKKFLYPILICVNSLTVLLQLVLSQSLGFSVHAPLMTLFLPILFLLNTVFFIYWIIRFRWPFLFYFGMLLLSYSQIGLLFQSGSPRIETTPGAQIMSYNVRLFNRYGWLADKNIAKDIEHLIQRKFPEVICFQEYSASAAPSLSQYPHRHVVPGLAIYSRLPLVAKGNIQVKGSPTAGIYSDMLYKGDTLRVYNIHMESFRLDHQTDSLLDSNQTIRLRKRMLNVLNRQQQQLKTLVKFNQKNRHPSVVCVDLNNNAFSEVYQGLSEFWTDAFTLKGSGLGATYRLAGIPMRIDFIFSSPEIKVLQFQRFEEKFSDHQPIMVRIQIP
ncbi:MAG: endonuclease/exonuclease/phosphatase family protein [Flavobacteriaceae bacterium]